LFNWEATREGLGVRALPDAVAEEVKST